jgi:hypothetical protein
MTNKYFLHAFFPTLPSQSFQFFNLASKMGEKAEIQAEVLLEIKTCASG